MGPLRSIRQLPADSTLGQTPRSVKLKSRRLSLYFWASGKERIYLADKNVCSTFGRNPSGRRRVDTLEQSTHGSHGL